MLLVLYSPSFEVVNTIRSFVIFFFSLLYLFFTECDSIFERFYYLIIIDQRYLLNRDLRKLFTKVLFSHTSFEYSHTDSNKLTTKKKILCTNIFFYLLNTSINLRHIDIYNCGYLMLYKIKVYVGKLKNFVCVYCTICVYMHLTIRYKLFISMIRFIFEKL